MAKGKTDKIRKLVVGELHIQSKNDSSKTYSINIDDIGDKLSFSNLGTSSAKKFVINPDGTTAAVAPALTLTADNQIMTFGASNTLDPANQSVTFTASIIGDTGIVKYSAKGYDGSSVGLVGGSTDKSVILTGANFGSLSSVTVTATATLDNDGSTLTDNVIISKVQSGVAGADGDTGAAGTNAKAVKVTANDYQIAYNKAGATPAPTSITITATQQNHSGTYHYHFYVDNVHQADNQTGSWTGLTVNSTLAAFGAKKIVKVETRTQSGSGQGSVIATDSITIIATKDGSDGITVVGDNLSHTLPAENNGAVTSHVGSGINLDVYIGGTQLTANTSAANVGALSADQFGISAVASNITVDSSPSATNSGKTYSFGVASLAVQAADNPYITFSIFVKDSAGNSRGTIKQVQTFSKSKKGGTGATGTGAKVVTLSADKYIITYNGAGALSPGTQAIALTAAQQGHSGTVYYQFLVDDVSKQNTTTATYTIGDSDEPTAGGSKTVKVKTREGSADSVTVISEDTLSVYGVKQGADGKDAITVVMPNENHAFVANAAGTVSSYSGGGTDLFVFQGASRLTPTTNGSLSTSQFSASIAGTSIMGGSRTLDTSGNDKRITYGDPSSMGADNAKLVYTVSVKNSTNDTYTFTKQQSFSKSKTGAVGANAKTVTVNANSLVFVKSRAGTLSPSSIAFTTNNQNTTDNGEWTNSAGTLTNINHAHANASCTVTSAHFVDGMVVTYTLHSDDGSSADSATLKQLDEGAGGVQAILSNEAHVLPASTAGVVSSFANSGTTIKVYEGATALDFTTGTVAAGEFAVAVANTGNITEGSPSGNGTTTCTIGPHSTDSGNDGVNSFVITYTITGKTANGTTFTSFTKTQSLSKSKTGSTGATGASNNIVFKRNSSAPSTPGDSTGVPSGWADDPPSGTNLLWASKGTKAVGDSNFDWAAPYQVEGTAVAEVSIYRKNSSSGNSGGSYNFTNSTLTVPTNWSTSVPTLSSNGDQVYQSVGLFSGAPTATAATTTWATPVVYSRRTDGATGATGASGPTGASNNIVFKRNSSAPSAPGDSSGVPSGWADDPPGGTDLLWASKGTKAVGSSNFEWSTPYQVEGTAVAEVSIYRLNSSAGNSGGSYNFTNTTLTVPTSWATSVPTLSSNGDVVYQSVGLFSGAPTATAATTTWASPVIYSRRTDGAAGATAKLVKLIYDKQAFTYGSNGSASPSNQVITITGSLQNTSATEPSWTVKNQAGADVSFQYGGIIETFTGITGETDGDDTWTASNSDSYISWANGMGTKNGSTQETGDGFRKMEGTSTALDGSTGYPFSLASYRTPDVLIDGDEYIVAGGTNTENRDHYRTIHKSISAGGAALINKLSFYYYMFGYQSAYYSKLYVKVKPSGGSWTTVNISPDVDGDAGSAVSYLYSLTHGFTNSNYAGNEEWRRAEIDLTSYQGSAYEIYISAFTDYNTYSSVLLDKLHLRNTNVIQINNTQFGSATSALVKATADGLDDEVTLVKLSDGAVGADAITVILTNESHTVVTDSAGNVTDSYVGAGTEVIVYDGATRLTPQAGTSTASNGYFRVAPVASNITIGSRTDDTSGTDKRVTYAVPSAMTADNATITYTVTCTTGAGNFTFTKIQSYTKSKAGKDEKRNADFTKGLIGSSVFVPDIARPTNGISSESTAILSEATLPVLQNAHARYGNALLQAGLSTNNRITLAKPFPIKRGKSYRFLCRVGSIGSGTYTSVGRFRLQTYNSSNTLVSGINIKAESENNDTISLMNRLRLHSSAGDDLLFGSNGTADRYHVYYMDFTFEEIQDFAANTTSVKFSLYRNDSSSQVHEIDHFGIEEFEISPNVVDAAANVNVLSNGDFGVIDPMTGTPVNVIAGNLRTDHTTMADMVSNSLGFAITNGSVATLEHIDWATSADQGVTQGKYMKLHSYPNRRRLIGFPMTKVPENHYVEIEIRCRTNNGSVTGPQIMLPYLTVNPNSKTRFLLPAKSNWAVAPSLEAHDKGQIQEVANDAQTSKSIGTVTTTWTTFKVQIGFEWDDYIPLYTSLIVSGGWNYSADTTELLVDYVKMEFKKDGFRSGGFYPSINILPQKADKFLFNSSGAKYGYPTVYGLNRHFFDAGGDSVSDTTQEYWHDLTSAKWSRSTTSLKILRIPVYAGFDPDDGAYYYYYHALVSKSTALRTAAYRDRVFGPAKIRVHYTPLYKTATTVGSIKQYNVGSTALSNGSGYWNNASDSNTYIRLETSTNGFVTVAEHTKMTKTTWASDLKTSTLTRLDGNGTWNFGLWPHVAYKEFDFTDNAGELMFRFDFDCYNGTYTNLGIMMVEVIAFNREEDERSSDRIWALAAGASVSISFTGKHRCVLADTETGIEGKIVSSIGKYDNLNYGGFDIDPDNDDLDGKRYKPNIDESIPIVSRTTSEKDKKVVGVVSCVWDKWDKSEQVLSSGGTREMVKMAPGVKRWDVNSIGEGGIWITNTNGDLENGDFICSSAKPGYGMKQDTEMLCNYTVAKITMDCDFDLDADNYECVEVEHEGTTYRAAFVGCTYHCG